jgi:hypothetical protein
VFIGNVYFLYPVGTVVEFNVLGVSTVMYMCARGINCNVLGVSISLSLSLSLIYNLLLANQAENASCPFVRIEINVDKPGQWDFLLKVVFMLWLPFLNRYTRLIYAIVFIGNVYFLYPVGTVVEFQYQ